MACVDISYVEHGGRRPCIAVMGLLCVLLVCPSCVRTCFEGRLHARITASLPVRLAFGLVEIRR